MTRFLWAAFALGVFVFAILAARFGLQAALAQHEEKAWSCGYAQARCDWATNHDRVTYCAEVDRSCGGLEWIEEGRTQ